MIVDENGNELYSAALRVPPGGGRDFSILIQCRAGYELRAVRPADITISAKAAPGDAFQNIFTNPLSLSAFAGQTRTIYFRVSADLAAVRRDDIAQIIVAPVSV